MLEIHIVTIFPEAFDSVFAESIIARAQKSGLVQFHYHDLRKWTEDERKTVDDKPFGGGPGMVMMLEPFYKAVTEIKSELAGKKTLTLLTSAAGEKFDQQQAQAYTKYEALIILCGHYEGIDERVAKYLADVEISIGDYVLTGGEIPAMVISDAVVRLLPGVLGNAESLLEESHSESFKSEYPQYTRPAEFVTKSGESWQVPDILLSGNHAQIDEWRSNNQKTADDKPK